MASNCVVLVALLVLMKLMMVPCSASVLNTSEFQKKKALCLENIENGLWGWSCKTSVIEKENCVLRCISAECYEKVYAADPLEEGEIDIKRGREFQYCLRRTSSER